MNTPHERTKAAAAAAQVLQPPGEFESLLQRSFTPLDLLQDDNFDKLWRMAEALANSALSVPKELKGNIGDCLAIVTQAMIWGLNPFAVAQKAHVINGKLGYEAQLVNAVVMQSGAIRGSFSYEYNGDACRVGAVLRGESEITWGEWLSAATVTVKNSPLWKTNPKQQMGYLQVKNWARAYCPGALLGIYSADELEAMPEAMTPAETVKSLSNLPSLPGYQQADFDKNLPAWTKIVAGGKKSASDLLAMLSTKATFSDEQKAVILSLKPAPAASPAADAIDPFVADMEAAERQGDAS
jgi:hypothetical protein